MKKRSLDYWEGRKAEKVLRRLMERLKNAYVVVEGQKDVKSLKRAGIESHPIREALKGARGKVILLTDMDEEGDRLSRELGDELRAMPSVESVDVQTRKEIAGLLNLNRFEEFDKKLEALRRKIEEVV